MPWILDQKEVVGRAIKDAQAALTVKGGLRDPLAFISDAYRRGARLQKLPHANSFVYLHHSNNTWSFPLGSYLDPRGWLQVNTNTLQPYVTGWPEARFAIANPSGCTPPSPKLPGARIRVLSGMPEQQTLS